MCSTGRGLDDTAAGNEGFDDGEHLCRSPICPAFDPAQDVAVTVDQKTGRQAAHVERVPDFAFRILIDLNRFEPELGNEWRYDLRPAAILLDSEHRNPIAEMGLQQIERRHLTQARFAPGRPQVEDDELAAEVG